MRRGRDKGGWRNRERKRGAERKNEKWGGRVKGWRDVCGERNGERRMEE